MVLMDDGAEVTNRLEGEGEQVATLMDEVNLQTSWWDRAGRRDPTLGEKPGSLWATHTQEWPGVWGLRVDREAVLYVGASGQEGKWV